MSRSVIVTGGTGEIGAAVALAFARDACSILLVDLNPDDRGVADRLREAGAEAVVVFPADVADEAAVARAADVAIERFGGIDVIVNVAGAMIYKPIPELTATDWRRLLDVNLVGAALFTGHALRVMKPGGSVVNVASAHARRTSALVAPYAAAKAGMVSLTRSAAIEGKPLGIRVNAVCPGAIDTQLLRDSPAIKAGIEVVDPADIGQPDDVAELVRFLASDQARFVTGEDVVCDGGRMGKL